jgi:predicted O-methyltransferase YrrM
MTNENEEIWKVCVSYKIQQKKTEFLWLLDKIRSISNFNGMSMDIGAYDGGSSAGFSFLCKKQITLDIVPQRYNPDRFSQHCNYSYYAANSHLDLVKTKINDILNGTSIDFLFIDGDHTYTGVKKDYEMYQEFVKPSGIIALHDITQHPDGGSHVDQLWKELKVKNKTEEIIDEPLTWGGIGIVWKS